MRYSAINLLERDCYWDCDPVNKTYIQIIPMQSHHIPDVVRIHNCAFQTFFLTSLGSKFLEKMYEGFILFESYVCSLAAYDTETDQIVGFVTGITEPRQFYRKLLAKKWYALGKEVIKSSIRNPSIITYAFINVLMRIARTKKYSHEGAELSSLAVDPDSRGRKVGEKLLREFSNEMKKRGLETIYLTTDKNRNDQVNMFYQKNGWVLKREFTTPTGRNMNLYCFDLTA